MPVIGFIFAIDGTGEICKIVTLLPPPILPEYLASLIGLQDKQPEPCDALIGESIKNMFD